MFLNNVYVSAAMIQECERVCKDGTVVSYLQTDPSSTALFQNTLSKWSGSWCSVRIRCPW